LSILAMAIPRRPMRVSFASARALNANTVALWDTVSARVAMPRTADGGALVSHPDELEHLPTAEQHRVDRVEVARFPELRDVAFIELSEFLLIDAVKPGERQRCAIVQGDVEQNRSKQAQREQGGNELLGCRLACNELVQDGQNPLQ